MPMRSQSASSSNLKLLPQLAAFKASLLESGSVCVGSNGGGCGTSNVMASAPSPMKNFFTLHEPAPTITALSAGVFYNGKAIFEKNITETSEVASLTKIMTLYCALKIIDVHQLDPERTLVCIPRFAASICGTSARLRAGEYLKLSDLFYALMLPSGNDSACAIASFIGEIEKSKKVGGAQINTQTAAVISSTNGTTISSGFSLKEAFLNEQSVKIHTPIGDAISHMRVFVKAMNAEALRLSMRGTQFSNPHGLSDKSNRSCVTDYGKLCQAAMGSRKPKQDSSPLLDCNSPQQTFRRIVSAPSHRAISYSVSEEGDITNSREYFWENTNKLLLRDKHVIGIKTGSTPNAGFCLATHYTRGDKELQVIVLKSKDDDKRWIDSLRLAEWAFRFVKAQGKTSTGVSVSDLDQRQERRVKKTRTVSSAFPSLVLQRNFSPSKRVDTSSLMELDRPAISIAAPEQMQTPQKNKHANNYSGIETDTFLKSQRLSILRSSTTSVRTATSTPVTENKKKRKPSSEYQIPDVFQKEQKSMALGQVEQIRYDSSVRNSTMSVKPSQEEHNLVEGNATPHSFTDMLDERVISSNSFTPIIRRMTPFNNSKRHQINLGSSVFNANLIAAIDPLKVMTTKSYLSQRNTDIDQYSSERSISPAFGFSLVQSHSVSQQAIREIGEIKRQMREKADALCEYIRRPVNITRDVSRIGRVTLTDSSTMTTTELLMDERKNNKSPKLNAAAYIQKRRQYTFRNCLMQASYV